MSTRIKVVLAVTGGLLIVIFLHLWLNTNVFDSASSKSAQSTQSDVRFNVGFLPVT